MKSKKRSLLNSRLYLILDKDTCYRGNVIGVVHQISKTDIDLLQLREKTSKDRDFFKEAKIIKRLCQKQKIVFIINNRLDIAQLINADGIHLGQSDLPIKAVRKILGKDKIIGITCHNFRQALKAETQGADYISIGPIFKTRVKPNLKPVNPNLINTISQRIKIPFFAIGGINHSNIKKVIARGAQRVALCRAICCAQNIKKAVNQLKMAFAKE